MNFNNRTKKILEMARVLQTNNDSQRSSDSLDDVLTKSSCSNNHSYDASINLFPSTFTTLQPVVTVEENQGFIPLEQSFQIRPIIIECPNNSDGLIMKTSLQFKERIELAEPSDEVDEILYAEKNAPIIITEELLDKCQIYEIEDNSVTNIVIERNGSLEAIESNGLPLGETGNVSDNVEKSGSFNRDNDGIIVEVSEVSENLDKNQGNQDEEGSQMRKKRKKNPVSVKERKNIKIRTLQEKHGVLEGCDPNKCKKRCHSKISDNRRQDINKQFWDLDWLERRTFILNTGTRKDVKRRTTQSNIRQNTLNFSFKDDKGLVTPVCKIFYLTTLGYKKSNDWVVHSVLKNTKSNKLQAERDRRGKQPSRLKISTTEISGHIESFNPCISHYRREHAPNVRYLPSDINITLMYTDFIEKYPTIKCSYELYRLQVKQKNISFAKLGHEECETCEYFKLHNKEHTQSNLQADCQVCEKWSEHIEKAKRSRAAYKIDSEKVQEVDSLYVSADLQKVIMLPRVDTFKTVLFTRRIIAYHESFVPLGRKSPNNPLAVVWYEGISGRNKEQIISTFYAFLKRHRDISVITLWLDNCASQNKNWALLSFLCYIINSTEAATEKIILKYFEPGHTFMSADSFHHQVEMSLKKQSKTYDFYDFVDAVRGSNKGKVEIKQMEYTDFYYWKDHTSQSKIKKTVPRPYLADIVQIEVERGSFCLKYKTTLEPDCESITLDFLCNKMMKQGSMKCPEHMERPCGIPCEKRDSILSNLAKVIPENRKVFWRDIATSD